jgi:hypothetical protein
MGRRPPSSCWPRGGRSPRQRRRPRGVVRDAQAAGWSGVPSVRGARHRLGAGTLLVASDGLLRYAKPADIARLAAGPDLDATACGLVELVRPRSDALPDDVASRRPDGARRCAARSRARISRLTAACLSGWQAPRPRVLAAWAGGR